MASFNLDFSANQPCKIRSGAKQTFTATFDNDIDLTGKTVQFCVNETDAASLTPVMVVDGVVVGQVAAFVCTTAATSVLKPKQNYIYTINTIDGDDEVECYATGKLTVTSINHL